MTEKSRFGSMFPPISRFNIGSLSHPVTYIGAAGFEDRATSVLDCAISEDTQLESAIAIQYRPLNRRNRIEDFKNRLSGVGADMTWITFDRYDPQGFVEAIAPLSKKLSSNHILVDISAMSKFLIMILLQALRNIPVPLTIVYTEAEIYHPTKEVFEIKKKELGATPDFLTTDVYKILTVSSLSSVSMQGYPVLLLAFPTFNHVEMIALYNELSPRRIVLLEGEPHEERDRWRLEAIREVNRDIVESKDYSSESMVLSTFDYISTTTALEEIYERYWYTHKILLAPTGSKLQTTSAFMFKQLHPDVQIVYPVTKAFTEEYSEKCRALWSIHISNFLEFISLLDGYRQRQ